MPFLNPQRKTRTNQRDGSEMQYNSVAISYIAVTSEYHLLFNKIKTKTASLSILNLATDSERLAHLKDKTARHKQSHVIYAVQCSEECSHLCISQTKQPLHRCMAQDRRDNLSRQYSAVHFLSIITEQKRRLQTQVASCLPCCPVIPSQTIIHTR